MLQGEHAVGRVEAAVALVKLGDSQALEVAFEALRDPDTRLAAVNALGYLKDKRAIGPLQALLEEKAPPEEEEEGHETAPDTIGGGELRTATLQALISIGDPDAIVPALEEALGEGRSASGHCVSSMAADWEDNLALIPRMGTAAVGPLQKALSHPWESVRAEAASLLFLTDGPEALAALHTTFSIQETSYVYRLIYNFYNFRGEEGAKRTELLPQVLSGLRGEDTAKRTEPLLEILASHKDRAARRAAAEWLSNNRDPRVIPTLRRTAAGDICPSVRAAAWQALEDLTGEDRPATVPPRWLKAGSALGTLFGDECY
jgi:HEAT repeat protein